MALHDRDYMRDGFAPGRGTRQGGLTAFQILLAINIAVFLGQYLFDVGWVRDVLTGERVAPMGAVSYRDVVRGDLWGLFTYMFVHGSAGHLLMNMLLFWFAGRRVQEIYGGMRLFQIYMLSGVIGAVAELAVVRLLLHDSSATLIGASAACFGVLTALAVAVPEERLVALVFFVIPLRTTLKKATLFLVGLNAVLALLSVVDLLPAWLSGGGGMVAYFAHLGGAASGWLLAKSILSGSSQHLVADSGLWEPRIRRRRPEMARATRRPVVEMDSEALAENPPATDPVVNLMRDEVDPILDKITEQGLHSLTEEERRTLERASRQMVWRDRKE